MKAQNKCEPISWNAITDAVQFTFYAVHFTLYVVPFILYALLF